MTLFMVGDSDQTLYRFSGANPNVLMREVETFYPDVSTIKLEVNYRSTKQIIDTCSKLIAHNYSGFGGDYKQELFKFAQARDNAPDGEPVTYTWHSDVESECVGIAEDIAIKLDSGTEPGSVFVGARTRAQLGYLEGELLRRKVPYINITGGSFWSTGVIADVVAYIRLAIDESDNESFKRIYNIASKWMVHPWGKSKDEYCHHRYLGNAFLAVCNGDYRNIDRCYKKSWQYGIQDLQDFIFEIQDKLQSANNAGEVAQFIIEECYQDYLQAEEGITSEDEAENGKMSLLETLVALASAFSDVQEFLTFVDEAQKASEAKKNKDWGEYVVLSTIHRLKGLERDIVYGMGWCEGDSCGLLPHTFSLVPPPQMGMLPTGGMNSISDERCIAFVLISRAKLECHLSGCENYRKYTNMRPSRFVYEAGIIETRE